MRGTFAVIGVFVRYLALECVGLRPIHVVGHELSLVHFQYQYPRNNLRYSSRWRIRYLLKDNVASFVGHVGRRRGGGCARGHR